VLTNFCLIELKRLQPIKENTCSPITLLPQNNSVITSSHYIFVHLFFKTKCAVSNQNGLEYFFTLYFYENPPNSVMVKQKSRNVPSYVTFYCYYLYETINASLDGNKIESTTFIKARQGHRL